MRLPWNSDDASGLIGAGDFFLRMAAWCAVFIAPIRAAMLGVTFLVLSDLITGIWRAKKDGTPITSWGLRRSVSKTLAYQAVLLTSFVTETVFLSGLPIVKAVAGLIAVTELKSNLENLHAITGVDFWSRIVDALRGKKSPNNPPDAK